MKSELVEKTSVYKIGAVARLTGISPDTLRIWERRYSVVTPERTSTGDRLYDADDIARLQLIKQLVDNGDSIGSVASLPLETLQARVDEVRAAVSHPRQFASIEPVRLVVVGESLSVKLKEDADELEMMDLVGSYKDDSSFENAVGQIEADVMVIDQPTLQAQTISRVVKWLTQSKIKQAVIVYRFANDETLRQLPSSKCSTLRAPVEAKTLLEHCLALARRVTSASAYDVSTNISTTVPAPPRRYNDQLLAQLATISSAIKCECPRHLAELITSLSAFEQYSFECESTSPRDAALHAYLNNAASHARHMIEDALDLVIETENLSV